MSMVKTTRRVLGEFRSAENGSMAVEFALVGPVLIFFVMLTINFGMAYNAKLHLVTAAAAGAAYAERNGTSLTPESFPAFAKSLTATAQSTYKSGQAPPAVDVLINNSSGSSAADDYYCISGSPASLNKAQPNSAFADCGNDTRPGKFVTLKLSTDFDFPLPTTGIVGSVVSLQETLTVRVQ